MVVGWPLLKIQWPAKQWTTLVSKPLKGLMSGRMILEAGFCTSFDGENI